MRYRRVTQINQELLINGIRSEEPVAGLTHGFYKYPARFSPSFTRATIQVFTRPCDLVYDPFMGGGTTLVEATALGRQAIGTDISSLAVFLARVKTTLFTGSQLSAVRHWAEAAVEKLNWWDDPAEPAQSWAELGYLRNINTRSTWRVRKLLEIGLAESRSLNDTAERELARCILLRTAQWSLDCRKDVPTPAEFRYQFARNAHDMVDAAGAYVRAVARSRKPVKHAHTLGTPLCLHRSVVGIEHDSTLTRQPISLVLTSPPYPGVHVLYHRWQIQGRRETPAPFWIANCLDGQGASYYTFGDRQAAQLNSYFHHALAAFRSISRIVDRNTLVVQMLAFSDPRQQLRRYTLMMENAGFAELKYPELANAPDGRVWRSVPNRKWYASQLGTTPSSSEVVLFHKLRVD